MLETLILVLAGLAPRHTGQLAADLTSCVRIEASGEAIDTEAGHAAPLVFDFDGDGVQDLLVGQFKGGALWVFRNEGTNARPRLAVGVKFKEGSKDGSVPYG